MPLPFPTHRRPPNFGTIGLAGLAAAAVVLLAATATLFAIDEERKAIDKSVRENAIWAAHQFDREVEKLRSTLYLAVSEYPLVQKDDVLLRYDILYSRATLLRDGRFSGRFGPEPAFGAMVSEAVDQVHALAPHFDMFAASDDVPRPVDIKDILAALQPISTAAGRILMAANATRSALRLAERHQSRKVYVVLGFFVIALTLSLVALIVLLFRQIRHADITNRKLEVLNAASARAAEAAQSGSRAKSTFLAMMSHEIRTPLNGILGTAELLDTAELTEIQRQRVSTIRECGDALLALVSDVLDFSKLESGSIDLNIRTFDLGELVDGVMEIVAPRARLKGLCLMATYPFVLATGDPDRLRQVLVNLVGNAVKFTEAGDVILRVHDLDREGGDLMFEVIDTGIGIDDDARPRLFTEFFQADGLSDRRFGGTGLGLAISKRIVDAMGGEIGVGSEPRRGSRFWFKAGFAPIAESRRPADERLRVMAVTPSPRVESALREELSRHGCMLVATPLADPPDLVVVDARAILDGSAPGLLRGDGKVDLIFGPGAAKHEALAGAAGEAPLTSRHIVDLISPQAVARTCGALPRAEFSRSGNVLVVEDRRVNRDVVTALLERIGLSADIADDGYQAVRKVAENRYDLILMDMQMPVMDGIEATRQIRKLPNGADTPIVALTANAFASDQEACLAAGMDDFLPKPVDLRMLANIVHRWLGDEDTDAADANAAATCGPPATVVDAARQAEIASHLGNEFLAALIASFWQDASTILDELRRSPGDPATVRRCLHSLKGIAESVGFAGVAVASEAASRSREAGLQTIAMVEAALDETRSATARPEVRDAADATADGVA